MDTCAHEYLLTGQESETVPMAFTKKTMAAVHQNIDKMP